MASDRMKDRVPVGVLQRVEYLHAVSEALRKRERASGKSRRK